MGGASAKRKKEKKKDFQKPKLRIGKAKPKAANFTDTSFQAKSIRLDKQSLNVAAPSPIAQWSHNVSLLRHKSDTQRKESLAYLTTSMMNSNERLLEPATVFLPNLYPLFLDGSSGVRRQLLKLLKCIPAEETLGQADQLLLRQRIGMTHLSADIRLFSMELLEWLLDDAGHKIVSCSGGWMKTLDCFLGLLGWQQYKPRTGQLNCSSGWSTYQRSAVRPENEAKAASKQMSVLAAFIRAGIQPPSVESFEAEAVARQAEAARWYPLWHTRQHLLPEKPQAFAHLNLFGPPRDEWSQMYEDREDRQALFAKHFRTAIEKGIEQAQGEGGELGRFAAAVRKAVHEGMSDYDL